MDGKTGISALIQIGAELEHDAGMEAIACGRGAVSDEDCVLEICGKFLAYRIALRGVEVRLSAQPMDTAAAPEMLLRAPDSRAGWETVRRLCAALEGHEIKALHTRPLEVGPPGPDCFVIG
jgi:hypothetical protein